MRHFITAIITITTVLCGTLLLPTVSFAADSPADQVKTGIDSIGGDETGDKGKEPLLSLVHKGINVLLFITGAVAVLMVTFGGMKYVTSRGESAEVTSAKNTILYAVIGLVISLLAYAVVQFVVRSFTPSTPNATQSSSSGTKK